MRIIQIIDSLEAGGAERMAVNYANALADTIPFSGLVVSRKEGPLLNQVNPKVSYLFLNKKSTLDIKAVLQLRKFVLKNKVTLVQAHSTSFFLAFLLKISYPSIKLVWHDHYGDSEFMNKRPTFSLKWILPFFNGIIAVNQNLKVWAEQQMHFKNTIYLPNFLSKENIVSELTVLKGIAGKRILCLANLRLQKNHFLLLEVAKKLKLFHPEWSFHLVGKDLEDDYSSQIKDSISEHFLENNVFLYGTKTDVQNIMNQSAIAILTSQSEGLPVALLEYGRSAKPVVVTEVGEIPSLIQDGINGFLIAAHDEQSFYKALVRLIEDEALRNDMGNALNWTVIGQYSEVTILKQYLKWLETI